MSQLRSAPAPASAEPLPSYDTAGADAAAAELGGVLEGPWIRRLLAREPTADHRPSGDVTLSPWVRVRSALLLGLTVLGLAALLGAALSIVAVGFVFLAT